MSINASVRNYDAFISYRNADPDRRIARALHRALERYRVPRALVKAGTPRRLKLVFLDNEELNAGPLQSSLEFALQQSRFLIVICSPRTRDSTWVSEEVEYFKYLGRQDNILPLLIDGEPDESFPEQILDKNLLAADIRPLVEWRSRLKREKLRLIARLCGCDFDQLVQRHRTRVVRTCILSLCFSAVILGSVAGSLYHAGHANQRAAKAQERADALSHIEKLREDLQTKLTEEQARVDPQLPQPQLFAVADELSKALLEFDSTFGTDLLTETEHWMIRNAKACIANHARQYNVALKLVTDSDEDRLADDYVRALETRASAFYGLSNWSDASTRYDKILRMRPKRLEAKSSLGICYFNMGRLDEAIQTFNELADAYTQLITQDDGLDLANSFAMILHNRGIAFRHKNKLSHAENDLRQAIDIRATLVSRMQHVDTKYSDQVVIVTYQILAFPHMEALLADDYNSYGVVLRMRKQFPEAIEKFSSAITTYTHLDGKVDRIELENRLASSHTNRGNARADMGDIPNAINDYNEAIAIRTRLVEVESVGYLAPSLALSHNARGTVFAEMRKYEEAMADFNKSVKMYTMLVEKQERRDLVSELARSYHNRASAFADVGQTDASVKDYHEAIQIFAELVEREKREELADDLALSLMGRASVYGSAGQKESAMRDLARANRHVHDATLRQQIMKLRSSLE